MTFTYKEDDFRFQNLTALVSTSRGAEFLSAFDNPARGRETEVQDALRALFEEVLEAPAGDPVSRPRVEAALGGSSLGADAERLIEWIIELPDQSGSRGLSCAFYWHAVFMSPQSAEDREGPPEIPSAKWRSLRAAGEERPQDAPDPDPLAEAAISYRQQTAPLRALRDVIETWQKGPFDDFDLRLAERMNWPVADGEMWTPWLGVVEYNLTKVFWRSFHQSFSPAEKDAIFQWKAAHAADARAAFEETLGPPGLADSLYPDPPCHLDHLLRDDA